MKVVVPSTRRSPLGYDMKSSEVTVTLEPHDISALKDWLEMLQKSLKGMSATGSVRIGGELRDIRFVRERVYTRIQELRRLISDVKLGRGELRYYTTIYSDNTGDDVEQLLKIALAVRVTTKKCSLAMKSYRILRSLSLSQQHFWPLS